MARAPCGRPGRRVRPYAGRWTRPGVAAVAVTVAVSGTIGFVGLVIPHLTRLLWGPDHKHLVPLSLLTGSGFLMLADLVARTIISPIELPIGVITALIGAPVFAVILIGRKRAERRR